METTQLTPETLALVAAIAAEKLTIVHGYEDSSRKDVYLLTHDLIQGWIECEVTNGFPAPASCAEFLSAYIAEQFDGDGKAMSETEYAAYLLAEERARDIRKMRDLEREVSRQMLRGGFTEISVEFLAWLAAERPSACYDRGEMRMEAFGRGGMQGLNDFSDEWYEQESLYNRLEDWCARFAPLTYALFAEADAVLNSAS